ncbi:MAG: NYN domain-containing protein [Dokdonella sp.]|uniref:NYN domain-containing protein n=1 Tax=Dokdonella sp. TaxID=2291710 RepID=UPI0025C5D807|nr:NYN domain-containing protein [Dokdonella sp.]MBX3700282.1 NYN domain-containing protein [Dokdonella sp.]
MATPSTKLAVLIDADNAQPGVVEGLLAEVAKYGTATVKRIYGDWTGPQLKGWKDVLLSYAIQPIQQFRYTTGKNATDSALIIDAMDLLYAARLGGFCIVSSDSDFTRLAARVREAGLVVYGFGERKTPSAFVAACDKFIYTEILRAKDDVEAPAPQPRSAAQLKQDTRLVNLLRGAVEAASDDSGWANLGLVGSVMAKQAPEFDSRNYGYAKLSELIAASALFEVEKRKMGEGTAAFVRDRRVAPSSAAAGKAPRQSGAA